MENPWSGLETKKREMRETESWMPGPLLFWFQLHSGCNLTRDPPSQKHPAMTYPNSSATETMRDNKINVVLAGVAQWIEHQPVNQGSLVRLPVMAHA